MKEDAKERLKNIIRGMPIQPYALPVVLASVDAMSDEKAERLADEFGDPEVAAVLPAMLAVLRRKRSNLKIAPSGAIF